MNLTNTITWENYATYLDPSIKELTLDEMKILANSVSGLPDLLNKIKTYFPRYIELYVNNKDLMKEDILIGKKSIILPEKDEEEARKLATQNSGVLVHLMMNGNENLILSAAIADLATRLKKEEDLSAADLLLEKTINSITTNLASIDWESHQM